MVKVLDQVDHRYTWPRITTQEQTKSSFTNTSILVPFIEAPAQVLHHALFSHRSTEDLTRFGLSPIQRASVNTVTGPTFAGFYHPR